MFNNRGLYQILFGLALITNLNIAHAYIDPGTGSLLLQALIGTIAGAMVGLHFYWKKIVNLFRGNNAKDTKNRDTESDRDRDNPDAP